MLPTAPSSPPSSPVQDDLPPTLGPDASSPTLTFLDLPLPLSTPPPSPPSPSPSRPSISLSLSETLVDLPATTFSPPPPSGTSPLHTPTPALARGRALAQHLLGPQAHLRIEHERVEEERWRAAREEQSRDRVTKRVARERASVDRRRVQSIYFTEQRAATLTATRLPLEDKNKMMKKVAVFGLSVSLPSLSLKVKRPAFLRLRRSQATQPVSLSIKEETVSEKRKVKMVTVQSLARRTRELGGGEERSRAETWYLG